MTAYLDNSATTRPCSEAIDAAMHMLQNDYGNPSSLHQKGIAAQKQLIAARTAIAAEIGCDKSEIFFTSGGTEANNLAILGAAAALKRRGNRVVTTMIEHESVLEAINQLENDGFEVIRLKPDKFGSITSEQIFSAVNADTVLVSIMHVNNELGSVLPVETIRRAVSRANSPALVHIDAVQSFGKLPLKVQHLGADLLTITAHKIHGVQGSGALYVKKGCRILPRIFGGEQEGKIRPGTQSSPLIAAFGAAVKALPPQQQAMAQVAELRDYAVQQLEMIDGVSFNSAADALPYILNISVSGIRSQTLVQFLSAKGVCVSSGSACANGKQSHVLKAAGLETNVIDSALRISFCRNNTKADIDKLTTALRLANAQLARR